MSREKHRRLEELFNAALDGNAQERLQLLARLRQDDPALASELEDLLERDASRHDPTTSIPQPPEAPDHVGPYRIDRPLGEGGFAVVYLAHQEGTLERPVALKILKPGFDTSTILARFASERQTLAVMNHDGIARIYDAGTTKDQRSWFAMEYVDGLPITRFCEDHQLDTRQRLELFAEVCAAVQHAHQKGVIHRDLKPSNILVSRHEGMPRVKVIDFGIAKATAAEDHGLPAFTMQDQFIGTPEYMSPEQAGFGPRDVETRTDIYSLGVVLYELLTGLPPFSRDTLRQAGLAEIQRIVREEAPPRPSTRLQEAPATGTRHTVDRRALRNELDWVVLKAMEKDRENRYPSSTALVDDVRRFLKGEPLQARPPHRAYTLRKFATRHKLTITVLGALMLGTIGLTTGLAVAWNESRQREVETAAALAETEAVTDFLVSMIGSSEPYREGKDVTVRTVLDSTAAHIDADLVDQPLVAARVKNALGSAYHELGFLEPAHELLRQVFETHRRELGPDHHRSLASQRDLAAVLLRMDRNDQADSVFADLTERYSRTLGPDHANTVAAIHQRGVTLWEMSRYDMAERLLRYSHGQAVQAFPDNPRQVLSFTNNLANFLGDMGNFQEAEPLLQEVLDGRITLLGPDHPEVLEAWNNLAMCYADQGETRKGLPIFSRVLELQDTLLGPGHFESLVTRHNLAAMQGLVFNWVAAESLRTEGVRLAREHRHPEERITQFHIHGLGNLYLDLGQYEKAEALLQEAHALRLEHRDPDHRDIIFSLESLGRLELARGRPEEAIILLRQAVAGYDRLLGPDHRHAIGARVSIACWHLLRGEHTEARALLIDAVEGSRRAQGENHWATIKAVAHLSRADLGTGHANESRPRLRHFMAVADTSLNPRDPMHAILRLQLAACAFAEGDTAHADSLLAESKGRWDESLVRATPWPAELQLWEERLSRR